MDERLTTTLLGRVAGSVADAAVGAAARRDRLRRRGAIRVPGLLDEVEILEDAWGVPHVRAKTDADAFFAQGVCHARDRFFQMDMLRRVLSGRLAETVGERPLGRDVLPPLAEGGTTVDADRLLRALDLLGAARRSLARGEDEGRWLLDAYVAGVNAVVGVLRRRRPLEHRLLRLRPEPWRAIDSLLLAKGMALSLSFKWRTAPVFQAIAERLGGRLDLLESILPPVPGPGAPSVLDAVETGIGNALAFLPAAPPTGSNAFVVGAERSRSGAPLLASDPHLELSLPPVWHLASVRGARYAAVGASLPGVPGIVIGRTPSFAWGLTNGMIDDGDLWAETVDGTGTRYRVDGRWRPLSIRTETIRRRGAAPVLFRLRKTHRGPLFTDAFPAHEGPALSLRLTLHEAAADLEAFLAFGRARTADDVLPSLVGYGAPVQNLVFADTSGRAGFRTMGRVPLRGSHPVHPALVRDGEDGTTDWTGTIPSSELPGADLGPSEVLVTANDPQVDGAYGHYLSHLYEPSYRGQRLRACLAREERLDLPELARLQLDCLNEAAAWFRTAVLLPNAEAVRRTRPSLGASLDRLLAWDGVETEDRRGPALWHLLYHHLLRRTFGPALGPDLLEAWLGAINLMDAALRRAFEDPESPWAPPAARAALLLGALEDAERDLARRGLSGEAPWGRLHRLTLRHPLSRAPVLGRAFTRGPVPLRGGPYAVASGQYLHTRPASVVAGASYWQVVDLADPERRSWMITFGGESGAPGTRDYDRFFEAWREGGGIPMRLEAPPRPRYRLRLRP